eukprot:Sspe_Gene.48568::Locus_25413_Transcript_1_1_Confidence_1.000_Length_4431::g.48568::m.48568
MTHPSSVLYWEGLFATSYFNKIAWSGHQGLLEGKVRVAVEKLLNGEYRDVSKKQCGTGSAFPLYTTKLSESDRLLFTTLKGQGTNKGNDQILLLECIENHAYQKSRFMKPGVLRAYLGHGTESAEWVPCDAPVVPPSANAPHFTLSKVWAVLGGFVTFTDVQEKALGMATPLLIEGAAGTGKTCIAQALLLQAHHQGHHTLAYIAKSQALVDAVSESLAVDYPADVSVLTYAQLVNTQFIEVGHNTFCEWLSDDPNGQRVLKSVAGKDDRLEEIFQLVYEEFRIFSGTQCAEAYLAMGLRQKLLTAEKAANIPQAYHQYNAYLAAHGMVDLSFAEVSLEPRYDFVVVDECQDLSRLQIKQVCGVAREGRIVLCMDPQQSMEDTLSSKDYITSLCRGIKTVVLPETFRTPLAVVPLVNRLLHVRREMVGGVVHKDEYLEIQPSQHSLKRHPGAVHWLSPHDTHNMRELRSACGKYSTFAVVVGSSNLVEQAVETFDTPLVLTVQQAKGLEYEHVLLFAPFHESDRLLQRADARCSKHDIAGTSKTNRTKNKMQTGDLAYATPFNKLFVAFTRTCNALYIVQDPDTYPHLVGYIRGEHSQAPVACPRVPESTLTAGKRRWIGRRRGGTPRWRGALPSTTSIRRRRGSRATSTSWKVTITARCSATRRRWQGVAQRRCTAILLQPACG